MIVRGDIQRITLSQSNMGTGWTIRVELRDGRIAFSKTVFGAFWHRALHRLMDFIDTER